MPFDQILKNAFNENSGQWYHIPLKEKNTQGQIQKMITLYLMENSGQNIRLLKPKDSNDHIYLFSDSFDLVKTIRDKFFLKVSESPDELELEPIIDKR